LLFSLFFKRARKKRTNATEEQAKRWSKKKKVSGGGGVKHITVVTKEKIMPRAITYKVVLVSSIE